jgi:pyridoxal phosphate enzyme (YggS family)
VAVHQSEISWTPGTLAERYQAVKDRIAAAAARRGVSASDIILVLVTKNAAIDQIRELITLGHMDFGENRAPNLIQRAAQIEEFISRHRELNRAGAEHLPSRVRWHMIGHLQRNKVRKLIGTARLIHSVDSLRLAEEIQQGATRLTEPIELLIQVNPAGEKAKHGLALAAARHLVDQIDTMVNVRPRGLMAMAPLSDDPEQSRPHFERTFELFDEIRRSVAGGDRFDILSMGMTNDYEVAIECGANLVRVGRAVFGEPQPGQIDNEDAER